MGNSLSIGTSIVHEQDGLFSLKDLHIASGGDPKNQPSFFMRNAQTRALIDELSKTANLQFIIKTIRGRNASTYACRELVIAYAAWISAEFHLRVIRVFLDAQTKKSDDHETINPAQQRKIQEAVNERVKLTGLTHGEIYSALKSTFEIGKYNQLPADRFEECMRWINSGGIKPKLKPVEESIPLPINALLPHGRYMVSVRDNGDLMLRVLKDDEFVANWDSITDQLHNALRITENQLLSIRSLCDMKLAKCLAAAQQRIDNLKKLIN